MHSAPLGLATASEQVGALPGRAANPYASFWMAGFEGADHINAHDQPQDLVRTTGHLGQLESDYRRVASLGLRTIRESIGWRLAEPSRLSGGGPGAATRFNFNRTLRFTDAANRQSLQVMWTLMHYGFAPGVDLFAEDFAERFADFAAAAARTLKGASDRAPVYTPINEISFLAWAIAETNFIHPYTRESSHRLCAGRPGHDVGWEAKWRLVRAALLAMKAVLAEDSRARFLHVEPLTHVVPPPYAPHLAARADEISRYQWQAWDMLSGDLLPELGGTPAALDLLGVNYYHNCQWELETGQRLEWHLGDPRRVSMSSLLRKVSKRFDRPILIAETSHVGSGRALWMKDVGREVEQAMACGVRIQGVCIYPVVDRPDWNNATHWHNSGLFDNANAQVHPDAIERRLHLGYAKSLRRAQERVKSARIADRPARHLLVFSAERWGTIEPQARERFVSLTRRYQVVFLEEPVDTHEAAYLVRLTPSPGLEVLRPHTPIDAEGRHDEQFATLGTMVQSYLTENLIDGYIAWFRTPLAHRILAHLSPLAVVHDDREVSLRLLTREPPEHPPHRYTGRALPVPSTDATQRTNPSDVQGFCRNRS